MPRSRVCRGETPDRRGPASVIVAQVHELANPALVDALPLGEQGAPVLPEHVLAEDRPLRVLQRVRRPHSAQNR